MAKKRHPTNCEIGHIVRQHHPKGWGLVQRKPRHDADGQALPNGNIYCPPLKDRYSLYVYLHEVGHVRHQHIHSGKSLATDPPEWQVEYEAELYAITSMRAHGFAVDDWVMVAARDNVAEQFRQKEPRHDEDVAEYLPALKFAFPKTWRDWL